MRRLLLFVVILSRSHAISLRLFPLLVLLLLLNPGVARAGYPAALHTIQVSHDHYLAHSEPALAVNPTNPADLIAGSKMFTDPAHYRFKIGTYYSLDGGRHWHDSGVLPGFGAYAIVSDVSIAFGPDGTAYVCVLAWDGKKVSGIFVSRSADGGQTFSDPVPVYIDTSGAVFNDKPWIAVDDGRGPNRGNVYVAWNMDGPDHRDSDAMHPQLIPQRPETADSGIAVVRSTDGARSFSPYQIVAPFDQQHFYLGAIPAVAPDGTVAIAFSALDGTGKIDGMAMVMSHDGGKSFSPLTTIVPDVVPVPNHLPHSTFRNTSMPSFAISPADGSMVVVWADYRYGDADIMAARSVDGGRTWSSPIRVNHDRIGDRIDQFQPEVAVAPDGVYTCMWFDRRYAPGNRRIDVVVAQSRNDGRSFGRPLRVTHHSWNPAIDAPRPEGKRSNTFIGDYQALAVTNRTVHPLWNDTENHHSQQIRTATIAPALFR